jgi:hypothetical protein
LKVILDLFDRARLCVGSVFTELAPCLALSQQVPKLIELLFETTSTV